MGYEVQQMWDEIRAALKGLFPPPTEEEQKLIEASRKRYAREEAKRERLFREEEQRKLDKKRHDWYMDNCAGYGNECERFGIMSGCKPNCPVFERGQCEQQEENEKLFAEQEATP